MSQEPNASTGGAPRKRRRRRRKPQPGERPQADLEQSRIEREAPADAPLSPAEAAEMKRHLRFLFEHRKILRLRVNAQEDLLLNGARPPEHRGTCLHLLGKVDLACVESALTRVTEAQERVELLAGIVRFSGDIGILLLYLESLAQSASKRKAAGAFSKAVERIDFAEVSAARVRRLLDLIATIFDGHERVQVLFGLLQSESFRSAFDRSAEQLPDALAELFVPLRCVHEVVFEGKPNHHGAEALERGVALLLEAPDEALRAFPLKVRDRLLEKAVRLLHDEKLRDRAARVLLDSLPDDSRAFSTLGMLRAAELLQRHEDAEARKVLNRIRAAHRGFHLPSKWLRALDAPRLGRLALVEQERPEEEAEPAPKADKGKPRRRRRPRREAPAPESGGALREAFWLDAQQHVWLRTAPPEAAERFEEETSIQRGLPVAGVLPVACAGRADDGTAFAASPAFALPLPHLLRRGRWRRDHAFALALQGVQVAHALAVAGVELSKLEAERFVVQDGRVPALWLADFSGARRARGVPDLREVGAAWCESVFSGLPEEEVPVELRELVAKRPGLPELIGALAARV